MVRGVSCNRDRGERQADNNRKKQPHVENATGHPTP